MAFFLWIGLEVQPGDSINSVFQSTDAHIGKFALGERVIINAPPNNIPNLKTADTIIDGEPDPFVGFPITGNPTMFEGWYKFNGVGGDQFVITLGFQNSTTNTGLVYFSDTTTQSTYTHFSFPFIVPIRDSGMGTIEIIINGNHIGTELLIDDLALTGGAAVVPINNLSYGLEQNYPNPFNSSTTIRYSLPTDDHVTLEILNMLGERVALLEDGNEPAGEHQIFFNGELFASGPYVCRFILHRTAFRQTLFN